MKTDSLDAIFWIARAMQSMVKESKMDNFYFAT